MYHQNHIAVNPLDRARRIPFGIVVKPAATVALVRYRLQKTLQGLADDGVERGVLGVTGPVDRVLEGHGPRVGSRREP